MTKITSKTIFLLMVAITAVLSFQLLTPNGAFAACTSNNDCGSPRFYGGQFCQSNSLYQTKITYSCVNSACVSSQQPSLIQTCSGANNKCVEGLWYTGCTTPGTADTGSNTGGNTGGTTNYPSQCYANSYKKCVGNDSYWFDTCNVQQGIAQKCAADQVCQSGGCYLNQVVYNSNYQVVYNTNNTTTNTTYANHFSKGCQNNIVYWYDTAGNKNDVYQNCNYSGQLCQDGKCVVDPNPAPTAYAKPASTTTSVKTTTAPTCDTGKVLAQACVPTEAFTSTTQDSTSSTEDNTNVAENSDQKPEQVATETTETQNNATAAVTESKTNLTMEFLNKWYVWIIIGLIMMIFFIIVFRKSSSKVEGRIQKK
ncbi:MAG: hypothetical protein A2639_02895 [Candidatus Staskawiczbacteria bacterium RIFCSPHIGHO2_01_FULL_34_27]|uniref:Uncharacterized protein n=1 Tax=Candidatus Staskawiczbacteria bacterium RIFCSPHIGHO2_01_FULL_34_27 TaxID=1802199 RepID=A0A1G2HKM0_9BACT|nr:MAG: hypothetical protein A2639_02895 [Candidatus Staskawiczbacteria bacterium RIFCSPHIGHO2_01_FULL_34_27]